MKKNSVFIAGATSKLGKALVYEYLERGWSVYASGRNVSKLTKNENLIVLSVDALHNNPYKNAFSKFTSQNIKIDLVINCLGMTVNGPTLEQKNEDFINLFKINVLSFLDLVKSCLPHLKENAKILNIVSVSGLVFFPGFGLYSSSKAALLALGEIIDIELSNKNIKVVNIFPGAIKSSDKGSNLLKHKSVREKYPIIKFLLPMLTMEKAVNKIYSISQKNIWGNRIIIGSDALIVNFVYKVLPSFMWSRLMNYIWNKK